LKSKHIETYTEEHIAYFEQVIVTLLHRMDAWKNNLFLIGGLAPRYLFPRSHHAGTTDVDLVLSLDLLASAEAYAALERNLAGIGFEWIKVGEKPVHWRWRKEVTSTVTLLVDLLCDTEDAAPGFYVNRSGERHLAAINVWGANLAAQDFIDYEITADLVDEARTATETLRVAGLATFLVLKARAFVDRAEEKDAYDLVYCLIQEGPEQAAMKYRALRAQASDSSLFEHAESILRKDFASDEQTEGYRKNGAVAYARFLTAPGSPNAGIRRQREASGVVEAFLMALSSQA